MKAMTNLETNKHDPNRSDRQPRKKLKSKRKRWVPILVVLLLLLGGAGAYAAFLYAKFDQTLNKIAAPSGNDAEAIPVATNPITFLLLGIDDRGDGETLNSDTAMAISLNPITKSATVVSIPRDMEITFDGRSRKANYVFAHNYIVDKEKAFPKTKDFWSSKLGIPVDYMVTIDLEGFRKVVDVLGGVDVNVKMDMCYRDSSDEDGTNINLKAGQQHLDGPKALDYIRYRKSNCGTKESNDHDRNLRQQEVMNQLFGKLKSFNIITKVNDILDVAGDNIKTDVPSDTLKQMILSYMNIEREKIRFISLDGDWISPFVVIPNEDWENAKKALKIERMRTEANPNPTLDSKTPTGTDMKSNYRSSGNVR
ncbi:membrane transcriptional regulator-like protein [Paenibacillus larvae subsp. larvae DSM 25430]|uniref:Membrane transcriptional regulator-like protein n=2 Tax=Paenibacillus larvae subsp. larvae TaxID=147375 RepID=V9W5U9_9BACL|nr:membrane transcriptional regulator-like protein [Paenibacillus larvae subsp. larvae DSM 25430]